MRVRPLTLGRRAAFPRRFEKARRLAGGATIGTHCERTRWDPKDGELCLVRSKSGETLMEDRSDSDVQIDRRNWV
jgi:hypothetical protein